MAWVILGIAVITEIAWALSMKRAATNGTWTGASVPVILNFVNMGMLLFGERLNPAQIAFFSLVIVGVVGTKLFATA